MDVDMGVDSAHVGAFALYDGCHCHSFFALGQGVARTAGTAGSWRVDLLEQTDHTARPVVPDEPGHQSTNCDGHGRCASMRAESDRAPGAADRSVGPTALGGWSDCKALSHSSCREGAAFHLRQHLPFERWIGEGEDPCTQSLP